MHISEYGQNGSTQNIQSDETIQLTIGKSNSFKLAKSFECYLIDHKNDCNF